jgi:opacity protein-like surface antigen
MKKILLGTVAAVALLGASAASAQTFQRGMDRGFDDDGYAYSSGPVMQQQNWYGWLTSPYDPYSNASIGYNRNLAEPSNAGGSGG